MTTLTTVSSPSFLLNFPNSYNTTVKNNVWMKEDDEPVNPEYSLAQWTDLYSFLSSQGYCTIMPTPHGCTLQDLVFVANMGMVVDTDTVIISNFMSPPRVGEAEVGLNYFKNAGFKNVVHSPYIWEGEAETKFIRKLEDGKDLYFGGYGIRTDEKFYDWFEENYNVKVVRVKMTNDKMYHFDCMCFPVTQNDVMLCKSVCTAEEIAEMEKYVNIIDVPVEYAECGATNSVRVHNYVLNSSDINDIDPFYEKEEYQLERAKNQWLEDNLVELGMEPVFFNLSEYTKGGALLSCLVMHLNRFSYEQQLV